MSDMSCISRLANTFKRAQAWCLKWWVEVPIGIRTSMVRYRELVISGTAIAAVISLATILSPDSDAAVLRKFGREFTNHVFGFRSEFLSLTGLVGGVALIVTGSPWASIVRRYTVKPFCEFLLHTFGIAAGVAVVVWLQDGDSFRGDFWWLQLAKIAVLELMLAYFGILAALVSYVCIHGFGGLLSSEVEAEIPPSLMKLWAYIFVPGGLILIWAFHSDISRLAAGSGVGSH